MNKFGQVRWLARVFVIKFAYLRSIPCSPLPPTSSLTSTLVLWPVYPGLHTIKMYKNENIKANKISLGSYLKSCVEVRVTPWLHMIPFVTGLSVCLEETKKDVLKLFEVGDESTFCFPLEQPSKMAPAVGSWSVSTLLDNCVIDLALRVTEKEVQNKALSERI